MADQMESLKNLEELLGDENYKPSTKELLDLLESTEMEEELRESLRGMLAGAAPQLFGGFGTSTYLAVLFVALIFCIICQMEAPSSGLNLEKVVKQQLAEQIKNVDVLSMLQRIVDSAPESEENDDVRQRLQEILAHYNTLNEDEKTYFLDYIRNALSTKLAAKLDEVPMDMSEIEGAIHGAIMTQVYLLAAAGVIFLILLVFFGYKLYKSIKEKEKKREEKKKLKQMKKKK